MKKYVIIEKVNQVANDDSRPNTYLNQENRVHEGGILREVVVSRQVAVCDGANFRDVRTGKDIDVAGKRISTAMRGMVFVYPDGYRLLLTRFCDERGVAATDNFTFTPSMRVVNVATA